jgi:hypothetical protein
MWHCPHCGAPQAETARCWVCRRSSTTCSTCRHFRASLATDLNYCALDRRRRPLTGLELRGCWEERPASLLAAARLAGSTTTPGPAVGGGTGPDAAPSRGFVPVEDVRLRRATTPASAPAPALDPPVEVDLPMRMLEPVEGWEGRTSLFGEPER